MFKVPNPIVHVFTCYHGFLVISDATISRTTAGESPAHIYSPIMMLTQDKSTSGVCFDLFKYILKETSLNSFVRPM